MPDACANRIAELQRQGTPIVDAVRRAVEAAVWRHKCLGFPIVVCRGGQVVEIAPSEIKLAISSSS